MKSNAVLCLLFCLILLLAAPGSAEETQQMAQAFVTRGSQKISFLYPASCPIVDEGDLGIFVYQSSEDCFSMYIPKHGASGVEELHNNIGSAEKIIILSDDMQICAVHGDANHRMYNLDIVEIGLNLADGSGLVVTVSCTYGHTEVYNLLLTVLDSITDTALLEDWLNNTWIPYVSQS